MPEAPLGLESSDFERIDPVCPLAWAPGLRLCSGRPIQWSDDAFVRLVTLVRVQLARIPTDASGFLCLPLDFAKRSTSAGERGRLALAAAAAGGLGAMITGANTNIRHRDVIFHVQTEDSGRANPHIISHLYHGGTILASEKTEYGEKLDAVDEDDIETMVRGLIESQHKEMLRRLKRGEFDAAIEERLGTDAMGPAKGKPKARPQPKGEATGATEASHLPAAEAAPPTEGALDTKTPVPDLDAPVTRVDAKTPTPDPGDSRSFGEGIVSRKPLDEVILEYLSDKARSRADRPSPKRTDR